MSAELLLNQLHENGYRVTARRAVVETVKSTRAHSVEVYDMGRKNIAQVWYRLSHIGKT